MKTYIAKIETNSGSQQIQLAALSIQDAQAQIETRAKAGSDAAIRYSIQEQPTGLKPETTSALLNASGGMFACIAILAVATHYINSHFKDLMRGRK